MSVELLIDNSAWTRFWDPALPDLRSDEISDDLEAGRLVTCLPFLLEVGYSARSARDHAEVLEDLPSLPLVPIDQQAEQRALEAQGQLARAGHHRLPPVHGVWLAPRGTF